MQRFKHIVAGLLILVSGSAVMIPATVSADFKSDACAGVGAATGDAGCSASDSNNITDIIKLIINILSSIVGVVAVIMIIVGGLKYITSQGDSGNISSAKSTITYALVGLVIVALSQVLVHFVLTKASTAGTTCTATVTQNCTPATLPACSATVTQDCAPPPASKKKT